MEKEIEITNKLPIELTTEDGVIHYIIFEIKTRFAPTKSDGSDYDGMTIDGDIKETIYQMREF